MRPMWASAVMLGLTRAASHRHGDRVAAKPPRFRPRRASPRSGKNMPLGAVAIVRVAHFGPARKPTLPAAIDRPTLIAVQRPPAHEETTQAVKQTVHRAAGNAFYGAQAQRTGGGVRVAVTAHGCECGDSRLPRPCVGAQSDHRQQECAATHRPAPPHGPVSAAVIAVAMPARRSLTPRNNP